MALGSQFGDPGGVQVILGGQFGGPSGDPRCVLEVQVDPKWRLEASSEGKLSPSGAWRPVWMAKWSPRCVLEAQMEAKLRLYVTDKGTFGVQEALKLHFGFLKSRRSVRACTAREGMIVFGQRRHAT